ncbi:phage portal protein [Salicibibacter cibarius]|uniref:Phage portal protein n=2 Tax=Salicibibacter cibarius TaxID=2743000 RepID=A0A7T6Z2G2_9BACI|nr:phage portal protein [Salicibibacter cibarius]QQK75147.1 phage portal protein [Salicibibacter cibarius]
MKGEFRSSDGERFTLKDGSSIFGGGTNTNSGVNVSESRAMQLTAVYACVRILSETVAHLPFPVYKRVNHGKEKATDHHLYNILQSRANPHMTAFNFRETAMNHLLLRGNFYAEIERDEANRPKALWPLRPDKMDVKRTRDDRGLEYYYVDPDGGNKIFPNHLILHIPGMGFDGLLGYSPLTLAREAIGMGVAAEKYGASFYKNGGRPSGVLESPQAIGDEGATRMQEDWERLHDGLENKHRVALLEQGTTYREIGVTPDEAQFLSTRKFQTEEIARFFRVPPHMLGDLERATFSNIEQQSIDFVTHSITPWIKRWEQNVHMQLFGQGTQKTHFPEFVLEGLLRGDTESRYNAYSKAIQDGWMSPNDAREKENKNHVDGLDIYRFPVNMVPADKAYERMEQQPTPPDNNSPFEQEGEDRSIKYHTQQLKPAQKRAIHYRSNIRDSNKKIIRSTLKRIFEREEKDVMAKVKDTFEERNVDETFASWLSDYYGEERETIEQEMAPVMESIGTQVYASVQDELGTASDMPTSVQDFIQDYIQGMAKRISGNSFSRLITQLENNPDDVVSAFQGEFNHWQENRIDSVADEETVRSSGAITTTAFVLLGVVTMRWVSQGSESCPYCQEMNGTVVGVNQKFVNSGDTVGEDFVTSNDVGHPPLHGGCICEIVAED